LQIRGWKGLLPLPLLLALFALLTVSIYRVEQQRNLADHQTRQLLLARQASLGIHSFFDHCLNDLVYLAGTAPIINFDSDGKQIMQDWLVSSQERVRAITRLDAEGRILFTVPFNPDAIGVDVSQQKHVLQLQSAQTPLISDVFHAVQGYDAVAIQVPVFDEDRFAGGLELLIPFEHIAARYLDNIATASGSEMLVISRTGQVLYSQLPEPASSAFSDPDSVTVSDSYGELLAAMRSSREGVTTFTLPPEVTHAEADLAYYAAYCPVQLLNTFWSICISDREDEVLRASAVFRQRLLWLGGVILLIVLVYFYYFLNARMVLRAERELHEMEITLQQARKMEALGTLAGGVAHDLNNILSGLVSYPDYLLTQVSPESKLRKPLEIIRESGHKAATTVQDLLTMARRGLESTELINLNDVVRSYLAGPECAILRTEFPGLKLEADLADDLQSVSGSTVHVAKTIMNLVTNATEAMTDGGGRIRITTTNCTLNDEQMREEGVETDDYVQLSIQDDGAGIPPLDQERIFEPFYTKKKMGRSNSGLGMAVVWGIVKDHGGFIELQSDPGQGATFDVYLPGADGSRPQGQDT